MKREIVWTWAAENDAQEIFAALDAGSPESAVSFVATTDRLTALLQTQPYLGRKWRPPVRRVLLRRVCHGLFYVVEPSRIVVIAIQDLRRDPERIEEAVTGRLP